MYTEHFHLTAEPFSLSPDPAFLYASPDHGEALAALRIALRSRRGLSTMIGEVGTGKTTILYALLSELGPTVHTAYLANTKLPFVDLLRRALADFGLPGDDTDRVALLDTLERFLRRRDAEGAIVALVIDEAQNLDVDTFEHLRLLTNYETFSAKLLQVVLVGQPELGEMLRRPELRQIDERIAVRCRIRPLSWGESHRYLAHRLERAGGAASLFTPAARALLIAAARGLPRRINVLGHTALLFAYGRGEASVRPRVMLAALRERRRDRAAGRLDWRRAGRLARWVAVAGLFAAAGVATALSWRPGPSERIAAAAPAAPVAAVAQEAQPALPAAEHRTAPHVEAAAPAAGGRDARPHSAAPAPASVVVGPGMTLSDIARRFYGSSGPLALRRLRDANPGLRDPNRLVVGEVLKVPEAASARRTRQRGNG